MRPHTHLSPVLVIWIMLVIFAVVSTIHLFTITYDNRATRALVTLGI